MNNPKLALGVALVAVVIAIVAFLHTGGKLFGTAVNCTTNSCFTSLGVTGAFQADSTAIFNGLVSALANLQVGSSGTSIARVNTGQCYVLAYATTIAASTTAKVDCQATAAIGNTNVTLATVLPGVTFGDNVVASLSTTTAGTTSNGLILTGVSASTTAGYITLSISNATGAVFTWPTTGQATGSASYIVTK